MSTVDLACTGSAWVTKSEPDTNYHGASTYSLTGAGIAIYYSYLLLKFEQLPQQYWYYPVSSVQYLLTVNKNLPSLSDTHTVFFRPLKSDFDASTITYNSLPYMYSLGGGVLPSSGTGDQQLTYYAETESGSLSGAVKPVMENRAVAVYCPSGNSGSKYLKAYTDAATSSKRPILRVSLSDTPAYVKPQITAPEEYSEFDTGSPVTLSWTNDFLGRGNPGFIEPMAPIVQTGGTIYWREKSSTGAFTAVNFTGSDTSYTFAANYFPAKDIYVYVEPTYEVYASHASDWVTLYPRIFVDMGSTGLAGVHRKGDPNTNYPFTGSYQLAYFPDTIASTNYYNLLFSAQSFPSTYNYKAIANAGLCFGSYVPAGISRSVLFYYLSSGFDEQTVTWNTMPGIDGDVAGRRGYDNRSGTSAVFFDDFFVPPIPDLTNEGKSRKALAVLKSPGFMLETRTQYPEDMTKSGIFSVNDVVRRRAMLLDITVTSKPAAATNGSGYVNPHVAQTFRWEHVPDGEYCCYGGWATTSATFYYRESDAENWTSVQATAGASEVTLAAETLSSGTYEWKVTATDDKGTTATSDVYTINTTDAEHIATPITPNGSLENGDASIRFIWQDSSETGTAPSGADLAYSLDGEEWTIFAQPRTTATQYDAPGDTLPSGTLYWRVRSINADGVAGEWSSALSFLCFASPDAPIVTADGKPLLTVTWQSTEQQAYEVVLDGVTYGPYFGNVRSFQSAEYLSDGQHSVSVRVQNEYGLWSEPGTVSATVTNQPGAPITLRGIFDRDAELSWATNNDTGDYLVYRDDIRIGHTGSTSFTDRTCLGYHAWKVIAVLPDGYYTMSNIVNGELSVGLLTIAALSGGSWLELAKSANSDRSVSWSQSQNVSLRQFAGREYPDAEISPHRSMSASFDVAWRYDEAAQASVFADLIGRAVILKTPCEGVMIGILAGWQRDNTQFFKAYTCTVQRIHWRDYTDADN